MQKYIESIVLTRHPRRTCPNRHAHMWQYALQAARDCFLLFPFPITAISYVYVSVRYTLFPQSVWRNNRCIFQLSSLNLFRGGGGGGGAVFSQLVGRSWGDHIHNIALPPPPRIIKQYSVQSFYISHVVCELSFSETYIYTCLRTGAPDPIVQTKSV